MTRIGYDNIVGVLKGGIEGYLASGKPLDKITCIEASELSPEMAIYDVRNFPEYEQGIVENANTIPLADVSKLSLAGRLSDHF